MYERFTDNARDVLRRARDKSLADGDGCIETTHLARALAELPESVAAKALRRLGFPADTLPPQIEDRTVAEEGSYVPGRIPRPTRNVKRTIERAMSEARNLGHHYVGTEHLLLGLITGPDEVTAGVFGTSRFDPDAVREEVRRVLDEPEYRERDEQFAATIVRGGWRDALFLLAAFASLVGLLAISYLRDR